MKVVVLSQALAARYGGAAVSEASLCSNLQKRCPTVVLCRKGHLDSAFVSGFGLTDVKEVHPFDVLRLWRDPSHWLARTLSDCDILHVNGHWRWENILIAFWCRRRRVPYLLQPRGMLWLGHRKVALKRLFNRVLGNRMVHGAARLIALSQFEVEQWKPYGVSESRCVVQPNAVSGLEPAGAERPYAAPFFLYVGRLESRKNLQFLITAFARYVKDGGKADLLLVGPVERGYDRQLTQWAKRLSVTSRVKVLAPVYGSGKSDYLRHAIAVIYPSVGEPFGRVPFEALAVGGVPIVPVESGAAEYLRPFLSMCLYPIEDADALTACLRAVERRDSEALEAGLVAARAWVRATLDWTPIADRVHKIYEAVVEESLAHGEGVARGRDLVEVWEP